MPTIILAGLSVAKIGKNLFGPGQPDGRRHDRTRLWQTPRSSRYTWQDQAHILSHQRYRLHLMLRYFPSSRRAKSVPVVLLSMSLFSLPTFLSLREEAFSY